MKITTPEESAYILARLCSETTSNDVIKHHLKSSPTERDFRNRFAAVLFRAFLEAMHTSPGEYTPRREAAKLVERFDAARADLEKRVDDCVYGSPWRAGKHRATLAAIAVLEAVRKFARAYGAIRFDPFSNTEPTQQS